MKLVLRIEELAMALAAGILLYLDNVSWWWYLIFAVGPDISFLGYGFGNKAGAILYNIFHHKAIAIALFGLGFFLGNDNVSLAGIAMFGHSSMDRFFGYGLKHFEGFKFTHLGQIGK